ncbi:hypothetical protein ACWGII_19030 [Streptomyces sp. NPDC054855]
MPRPGTERREHRLQIGRAVGAIALLVLLLAAVGRTPGGASPTGPRPGGTVLQQSEDAPGEQPSATTTRSHAERDGSRDMGGPRTPIRPTAQVS